MKQVEVKNVARTEKQKEEDAKRVKMIANQWQKFSHTAAYKEFIEYINMQDYFAILAAKGPIITMDEENGSQMTFDREKAVSLLQRSVGYDIVKTYVDGYVNLEA